MSRFQTIRDPDLSLWQSAVDEVVATHSKNSQVLSEGETPVVQRPDPGDPMVQGAFIDSHAEAIGKPLTAPATLGAAATESVGGFAQFCSNAARQLAAAKVKGDAAQVAAWEAQFSQYQKCDTKWLEVADKYAQFQLAAKFGAKIPYAVWQNIDDFVIDGKLGPDATVAIVGDWGTGEDAAKQVLAQIARKKPDVVIHLGDIYYSCTDFETQNYFLQIWQQFFDVTKIPSFTLAGNHDMYSGGAPYYALLKTLGQPASYCCLRNDDWQFVMIDTGLHDRTPGGTDPTILEDTEVSWIERRLATAGGRKTVLLSHHQLFTRFSNIVDPPPSVDTALSVNPNLQKQLGPLLPQIAVWLWGHEHDMVIYEKQMDILARCVGNGGIPSLPPSPPSGDPPPPSATPHLDIAADETIRPVLNGEFLTLGYAIMKLNGPSATINYYMDNDEDNPVMTDTF